MKKLITYLLFFILPLLLLSQESKRDNIWMLGFKVIPTDTVVGINFNSGVPDTFSTTRPMSFFLTNASICDTNGQILFYTNGNYVANFTDGPMMGTNGFNPGFENLVGQPHYGSALQQGAIILPLPNHPESYIIFHMSADTFTLPPSYLISYESPLSLRYSIVDMSLFGGLGGVTSIKNKIIIADTLVLGRLAACRHANGRDWWVLSHELWSNRYYKVLVSPDSIYNYGNQDIGNIINPGMDVLGTAVFSKGGDLFAYLNYDSILNVFDFDRCTGNLSNLKVVYFTDSVPLYMIGCAFSPSGRYLYVCNIDHIFQLDTYSSNLSASKTLVATWDSSYTTHGFKRNFNNMKLGPDNKIYITTHDGTNVLHVINNPDSAGLNCNVLQHGFILPAYNVYSMPNVPNYALGPVIGSSCDSLSLGINAIENEAISFSIFPNPAIKSINIICSISEYKNSIFIINNSIGQAVLIKRINTSEDLMDIDIQKLQSGIYACKIINNNIETVIGKLSIIH